MQFLVESSDSWLMINKFTRPQFDQDNSRFLVESCDSWLVINKCTRPQDNSRFLVESCDSWLVINKCTQDSNQFLVESCDSWLVCRPGGSSASADDDASACGEGTQQETEVETPGMHCLVPPATIPLTSHGGEYEPPGTCVKINVPNGAVEESMEATLTVEVLINAGSAQCVYPDDVSQVSPLIMIRPSEDANLRKPIEITIPHTIHEGTSNTEAQDHIGVLQANPTTDGSYTFEKVHSCRVTLGVGQREGFATFQSQPARCCFFQLYADMHIKEKALNTTCCLCRMEPREVTDIRIYYYVLTYKMKPFIETVEKEFPNHGRGRVLDFHFKDPLDKRIVATNDFKADNWIITLNGTNSNKSVCYSTLDRWRQSQEDIELDLECGIYPPKFTMHVCPKDPDSNCGSVEVCVQFKGICNITDQEESVVDNFIVVQGDQPRRATHPHTYSPQLQALLDNRSKICSRAQHTIALFADLLLQCGLIDSSLNQKTGEVNGLSNYEKAGELMNAVQSQVESDTTNFKVFLQVLREAEMEDLAQQLKREVDEAEAGIVVNPPGYSILSIVSTQTI